MGAYIRHVDFADYAVFFAREEMSRFHPAAQSLPPSESDGLNSPGPGAGIMGRLIETLVRVMSRRQFNGLPALPSPTPPPRLPSPFPSPLCLPRPRQVIEFNSPIGLFVIWVVLLGLIDQCSLVLRSIRMFDLVAANYRHRNQEACRMRIEEHHFGSKADAGASKTNRQQAGTIRKNGYIVIKGRPCKVGFDLIWSSFLVCLSLVKKVMVLTGCVNWP